MTVTLGDNLTRLSGSLQRPARWRVMVFFACLSLPIVLGGVQFVWRPMLTRLACPSNAIACWTTSEVGLVFSILTSVALAAFAVCWALLTKLSKSSCVAMAVGVPGVIATALYLDHVDAQQYDAIVRDGVQVTTGPHRPPTVYEWNDMTGVSAWCETGSRSGPKIYIYFQPSGGPQIRVAYATWRSAALTNPSIAARTNLLPYRTRRLDLCAKSYDRLPISGLN